MMTPDQVERIEIKIDKLTEAVNRLVLVEERQIRQGERLGAAEQRMAVLEENWGKTDRKVDKWINFGIGAWSIAVILFAVGSKFFPVFGR